MRKRADGAGKFPFYVVPGSTVSGILDGNQARIMDIVRRAYLLHEEGESVNPDSYFLRFPEDPGSRVIALPARLGGDTHRIGVKWISSFPENTKRGIPRASAVLVLNDYHTGYPIACLEGAGISAARTAASAAVAAEILTRRGGAPQGLSFVGAGVIARTILDYLMTSTLPIGQVSCFDLDPVTCGHFCSYTRRACSVPVARCQTLVEALEADMVVFATTATEPHVPAQTRLRPGQVVLNISLRDLAPEILLAANNVVDDIEHCLKAGTSPHLAEQLSGSRAFITGTLGGVLGQGVSTDPGLPTVFSPFGLGVLDIAVGDFVLEQAIAQGGAISVPDFFGETRRW